MKSWVVNQVSRLAPTVRGIALARHLEDLGWSRSANTGVPARRDGSPLPWWTYSSCLFVEPRLHSDHRVVEWGSGQSTLWFANHVAEVVAIEHDESWFRGLRDQLPSNATVLLRSRREEYLSAVEHVEGFDLAVIDGLYRNDCASAALGTLSEQGVIVWDNADRSEYQQGFDLLMKAGFHRIDFAGIGPVNSYIWTTAVFYREDNVLGI